MAGSGRAEKGGAGGGEGRLQEVLEAEFVLVLLKEPHARLAVLPWPLARPVVRALACGAVLRHNFCCLHDQQLTETWSMCEGLIRIAII